MGWIEHYIDPQNMRAVWNGWVAIVDKNKSEKFNTLANNPDPVMAHIPWNSLLEREKFNSPDFTSLSVVTYAGDLEPEGINIPNYAEIRENEGFKNVIFETQDKPENSSNWKKIDHINDTESYFYHGHIK